MHVKKLAAPAVALALLLALTACGGQPSSNAVPQGDTKPATSEPAEPAAEKPKPTPTEKPAEEGTLAKPYPVGYVVSIYEGDPDNELATLTVAIKDANAGAAIAQANQFNEPAQPGYHYVAVEYTMTGSSATEPANMSWLLSDWSLAQTDGVLIGENNTGVVMPDGWNDTYMVNDLYQGQVGAAVVVYQVPDAYTGPLLATAYGKYLSL